MSKISEYTNGNPPADGDEYVIARAGKNRKLTWANLKTALKTYFDLFYGSDGWISYSTVIPTRSSADDPTYVITFAGVDLTGLISVGMRLKWTQGGTVRYGFVTAIAYSTNTAITLYGGTDYDVDDTAVNAISDFYYSSAKAPFGFPLSPAKWTVSLTDTAQRTQASPVAGTWYNVGSLSIDIPIGAWNIEAVLLAWLNLDTAKQTSMSYALSTSSSSVSGDDLVVYVVAYGSTIIAGRTPIVSYMILASKTTHYLIINTGSSSNTSIEFRGDAYDTIVRAVCAYL